ncbi:MAG: hypothetical protein WC522_07045 [Candidatus Omnitrophota bacterium]
MAVISIICIGVTAMAAQIIFMRELLIIFYGSELSISFILASWLFGGAAGSLFLGRFADTIKERVAVFGLLQLAVGAALPVIICIIRALRGSLHIAPGEIIPVFPMIVATLAVLVPFCAVLGFLFSLGSRIYKSAGKVYVLEGIGAAIGGGIAGCILIKLFNSIHIMAVLAVMNFAAAAILLHFSGAGGLKKISSALAVVLLAVSLAIFAFNGWERLEVYSLAKEWAPYELTASKNSIYGNIVLTKRPGQFAFFDNGLFLYALPDRQRAEESVHFALLEHPDPREILLIGGGAGGLVAEALKHPGARVDYVELDPLIVLMVEKHLPGEYSLPLHDRRTAVKNTDGRFFVKTTAGKYDCIIINVGDPYTAQLNRFYTREFFEEAKRVLRPGGLISFGVTSSENFINKELAAFLRSIYATLKCSFRDVLVIPGETAHFLATDEAGLLTYDYAVLMDRARVRGVGLEYVREYYLSARLSAQNIAEINRVVTPVPGTQVNRDLYPVSYFYNIAFWTSRFRESLCTKIFAAVSRGALRKILFALYGIMTLVLVFLYSRKDAFKKMAMISLAGAGFGSMAVQMILLLTFQILYGYLFYKLSMILALFMLGLVAGGWSAVKLIPRLGDCRSAFLRTQLLFVVYPLALPVIFGPLGASGLGAVSWFGQNVVFNLLPLLAGFIGGFQFPLANKICAAGGRDIGAVAGMTYGVDLIGSCLGALVTGVFLIPVLGIPESCWAAAALNFILLAALYFTRA